MMFIRRMQPSDLAQIVMIEQLCHDFPWTEGMFRDCLARNYDSFILEEKPRFLGFALMQILQPKETAEILDICIAPAYQRQYFGSQLLSFLIDRAEEKEIKEIFLEVRRSNAHAQAFYQKHGFKSVGLRKNYYPSKDGRVDALLLTLSL